MFLKEVALCVLIDSQNSISAVEGNNWLSWINLITCQIVVSNKVKTWLVDVRSEGELLSLKKLGESVTTIIRVVDFTNLNSIVGHIVMDNEGKIL